MAPLRKKKPADQRNAEQQLADLRAALAAAKMREREAGATITAAAAGALETRQARIEAHAGGDAARVEELSAVVADAALNAAALEDQLAGAALASRRAADEVERYIASSISYLIAERAPEDRAAAAALEAALKAVVASAKVWESRAAESAALARAAPDEHPSSVPSLAIAAGVVREARAVLNGGGVPVPSVRGMNADPGWRIEAGHEPDESEREAARAAIRAKAA